MQQVGKKAFLANAQVVNPRALPALRNPRRRALIGFSRAWVLHRKTMQRIYAGIAVCIVLVIGVLLREPAGVGLGNLGLLLQGEFADAGFAVGEIRISGQTLTEDTAILAALGIAPQTSTLSFDVAMARERIAELPAIETVTIRKVYPGDVVVDVTERQPVARWRVDGITFLVDGQGNQIGEDRGAWGELPLVIGDGAADDAIVMIRALANYPGLTENIAALSRIADRRWDMIYDTGLRVQLPEAGVAQALRNLESYQDTYQLLDRDLSMIDLRVSHLVAVRPTVRDEEETEDE